MAEDCAFAERGRKRNGVVLEASKEVDADVGIQIGIFFGVGSCVNERGGAAPVFVRSVREENFGENFFGDGAIEETAFFAVEGVGFGLIGEWEDVGWEKD